MKAIITVVGPDRVGIIAEVCTCLLYTSQPHIYRDMKLSLQPMWTKHIFTRILCSTRSMPSLGKCITAPARITTNRFAVFQIGCAKRMV